jgi:hypothetical protein
MKEPLVIEFKKTTDALRGSAAVWHLKHPVKHRDIWSHITSFKNDRHIYKSEFAKFRALAGIHNVILEFEGEGMEALKGDNE